MVPLETLQRGGEIEAEVVVARLEPPRPLQGRHGFLHLALLQPRHPKMIPQGRPHAVESRRALQLPFGLGGPPAAEQCQPIVAAHRGARDPEALGARELSDRRRVVAGEHLDAPHFRVCRSAVGIEPQRSFELRTRLFRLADVGERGGEIPVGQRIPGLRLDGLRELGTGAAARAAVHQEDREVKMRLGPAGGETNRALEAGLRRVGDAGGLPGEPEFVPRLGFARRAVRRLPQRLDRAAGVALPQGLTPTLRQRGHLFGVTIAGTRGPAAAGEPGGHEERDENPADPAALTPSGAFAILPHGH